MDPISYDTVNEVITTSVSWLDQYPGPAVMVSAMVAAVITLLACRQWMHNHNPDEEMKRRAVLDQMYADDFGDVLFNRLMAGDINRHEYRRDCKRFGIAYKLGDLLVRKNPKRGLKYRVEKNCAEMHRSPSLVDKLPGQKPGEGQPVLAVVVKRKVWSVQGMAKLVRRPA